MPDPAPPIPKSYHHGDLRRALLDAALTLNQETGLDGLTLREVARRAGVSHTAPYRHFSDKAALIGALALDGWQLLTRQLRATTAASSGSPGLIAALGVTYVQFAAEHSALFRLMVRPELSRGSLDVLLAPGVANAAHEAFAVLLEATLHGQQQGYVRAGDAQALALAAWSAVHGLSVILLDGLLPHTPEQVSLIAGSVAHTVVQGLAVSGATLP